MSDRSYANTVGRALRTAEKWIVHHQEALRSASRPLRPYLEPFIDGRSPVRILDVGAGIVPSVGTVHSTTVIDLVSIDILACGFRDILAKWNLVPDAFVDYQDMTVLTFPDECFDIVHCSNALDHTASPTAGIREMIRVCVPGGIVYLRHAKNVGKLERYTGLHQWNIQEAADHDCLFWTPTERFLLAERFPGFVTHSERPVPGLEGHRRVVSVLRKP
jgi:SAM-dependent methyltransferase